MEPVVIAHLSDLHFGEKEPEPVWDELVEYLNNTLKPHLVLITGDVVNTPDRELFRRAKEQIDRLQPRSRPEARYRLCPGNHDRFWLGNSAGKSPGWLDKFLGREAEQTNIARPNRGELENFFKGGLVLTPELPFDLDLPSDVSLQASDNSWKIRVLGCDSCEEDIYFAQGVLNVKSIGRLRAAAVADTTVDLVILLIHHHLLPIASLEKEQPSLLSLANVTGMLNAGTALNMLAASHVNVVLHGHEHHPQASRFRTYDAAYGEVAVVSAGSSTGTKTLEGWSMRRARFNVLELLPDRSVLLKEINGEKGYFAEANRPPIHLLNAEDIRRARFLRKATRAVSRDPPRSRLTKVFEFRHDRDGVITETRTDWLIGDAWVMPTQNRTGTPTTATVEMHFGNGQRIERTADFVRTRDGDNSYTAVFDLTNVGGRRFDRVITSWSWEAGAILTQDELATLRDPGEFRKDRKEFVGVEAPESDLEELLLVVKLPEEFAPDYRTVEVWTSSADAPTKWRPNIGLGQLVQSVGRGLFSLRVPFPLPRWRYALCWPIAPGLGRAQDLVDYLTANSGEVHGSICRVLSDKGLPNDATVGLYFRNGNSNVLDLGQCNGKAPNVLEFDEPSGVVRGAWWGRLRTTAPEEKDSSGLFVAGDAYVALVPLRQPGADVFPAAALVRIAIRTPFPHVQNTDEAQVSALRSVIAKASSAWYTASQLRVTS